MKPLTLALLSLLAGFVGGVAGTAGTYLVLRRAAPTAPRDEAAQERLREAVAALEKRLPPPASAPGLAGTPGDSPAPAPVVAPGDRTTAAPASAPAPGARLSLSADEIRQIASEAADAALEKRAKRDQDDAKAAERKKATLAEAARELGLTAAQENEIRAAYADATEEYLKVFAEPEQTPDELRRELEAAKDDPAKKTAITMKHLPKLMNKLGDVMAIETKKEARVNRAVGGEKLPAFRKFKIAEEDPFGLDDADDPFTVDIGTAK